MDPAGGDRAALLPPGAGYGARRGARWAVVLVAGAAVVLLAVAAQRAAHSSALVMLEGAPAAWWRGKNHDPPMLAHNGEQCWMCPCCAGCESTPAARAAGCGGPGAAVRHAAIQRRAAGTGKSQAALGRTAAAAPTAAGPSPAAATTAPAVLGAAVHGHSLTMARAAGAAGALPARPLKAAASAADTAATAAPVAAHAKEAALPRKRVAGRAQATMGAHKANGPAASAKRDGSNPSWKEKWRPDEIKEPAAAAAVREAAAATIPPGTTSTVAPDPCKQVRGGEAAKPMGHPGLKIQFLNALLQSIGWIRRAVYGSPTGFAENGAGGQSSRQAEKCGFVHGVWETW